MVSVLDDHYLLSINVDKAERPTSSNTWGDHLKNLALANVIFPCSTKGYFLIPITPTATSLRRYVPEDETTVYLPWGRAMRAYQKKNDKTISLYGSKTEFKTNFMDLRRAIQTEQKEYKFSVIDQINNKLWGEASST